MQVLLSELGLEATVGEVKRRRANDEQRGDQRERSHIRLNHCD